MAVTHTSVATYQLMQMPHASFRVRSTQCVFYPYALKAVLHHVSASVAVSGCMVQAFVYSLIVTLGLNICCRESLLNVVCGWTASVYTS